MVAKVAAERNVKLHTDFSTILTDNLEESIEQYFIATLNHFSVLIIYLRIYVHSKLNVFGLHQALVKAYTISSIRT